MGHHARLVVLVYLGRWEGRGWLVLIVAVNVQHVLSLGECISDLIGGELSASHHCLIHHLYVFLLQRFWLIYDYDLSTATQRRL
jgi:hypothetical protein